MELAKMAWPDVETYLAQSPGIILPVGSTEQHGPMGMIGTDALCAEAVALAAAEHCECVVAPTLSYTPAPFNTSFPGTLSLSAETFRQMAAEVVDGMKHQGFRLIYVMNGHGANLAPLAEVCAAASEIKIVVRSWWEFAEVQELRQGFFGDWEGMHATPSEVAITQHLFGTLPVGEAKDPPEKLSLDYIRAHSGDRHGPPDEHRAAFPDGRVGSHSALATPESGAQILQAAARGAAKEYLSLLKQI